jgi:hypothetical protein
VVIVMWSRLKGMLGLGSAPAPTAAEQTAQAERLADWEQARPLLRLRVYPEAAMASRRATLIERPDFPGLVVAAVLDLPNAIALASTDYLPHWKTTAAEVLEVAFANCAAQEVEVVRQRRGTVEVALVHGDVVTSAQALMPGRHLPDLGRGGALVSLPCRDVVMFHRLGQAPLDLALMTVGSATAEAYDVDEAPLSRDLFWWREGVPSRRIGSAQGSAIAGAIVDKEVVDAMRDASGLD